MNILNKKFYFSLIFLFLLFWALVIYRDFKITFNDNGYNYKIIEIDSSNLISYKDNKILWQISVKNISSGRNQDILQAEKINNGLIYNDKGLAVIKDLSAENITANKRSESLTAFNITGFIIKNNEKMPNNAVIAYDEKDKVLKITAKEMRYFGNNKRTYFYNGVVLSQGKSKIYTSSAELDNEKNIAYLDNKFLLVNDEFQVSGNQMIIYIDDEYAELMGNINGFSKGKKITDKKVDEREAYLKSKDTYLKCDYLKFITKDKQDFVELKGNINIYQADKAISGNVGTYDKKTEIFTLSSNVIFNSNDLTWLLKKQKYQNLKNKEIKDTLKLATILNCDSVVFDAKNKTATFLGNIRINQKNKSIIADKMDFDDKANLVTLIGNVQITRNKTDKLVCRSIKINLDTEDVLIENLLDSAFVIKPKPRK